VCVCVCVCVFIQTLLVNNDIIATYVYFNMQIISFLNIKFIRWFSFTIDFEIKLLNDLNA